MIAMGSTSGVLDRWAHYQVATGAVEIPPDGCCDVIVTLPPGARAEWTLFALATTIETKTVEAGATLLGARLRPGSILDADRFFNLVQQSTTPPDVMLDRLEEFVRVDSNVDEALALLAQGLSVRRCAGRAGVSERSLQRLVTGSTGKSPVFWRQLARARVAARCLVSGHDISAVAYGNGFSDQAHLTREMRRWFRCSPSALRAEGRLKAALSESGYA
ncbi:MAG: helix-turn-helix transcriptional regulator [Phenylobacterium sp.]|nr:helix-turn-helix transcriptional regulator [Phenylobacterium sp.]